MSSVATYGFLREEEYTNWLSNTCPKSYIQVTLYRQNSKCIVGGLGSNNNKIQELNKKETRALATCHDDS